MKLPRHVSEAQDRHGKTRYRFRKAGLPSRMVHGRPGTAEFAQSYERCFDPDYQPAPRCRPRPWVFRDIQRFVGRDFVYFIGSDRGPVKIGTTVNLAARLKKLQTGNPTKLKVLVCIEGGADLEALYHARFEPHRLHGEWFAGRAIRDEIKRLRRDICRTFHPGNLPNQIKD